MADFLWIPVTLAAAFFQIVRTALQKRLKSDLDDLSVTWVRYGFALPLVWAYGLLLIPDAMREHGLTASVWAMCLAGGISQIFGTVFLLGMFSHRNFAVSTTFAKTEGIQIAVLGVFLLSEQMTPLGWVGVVAGTTGVLVMIVARSGEIPGGWPSALLSRMALLGTLSGTGFALTALMIRNAFEAIDATDGVVGNLSALSGSATVLTLMVSMQAALLGAWLAYARRETFGKMLRQGWITPAVGVTSFVGSALWFAAFSLAHPAYVKTLSNIELPLAVLVGSRFFKERHNAKEYAGMVITAVGITAVLYA